MGTATAFRGWRTAMQDALYGPGGFYRRPESPAAHFRTSAHLAPFADAVHKLAACVWSGLGEPEQFTVVDMGAGGGELVGRLATRAPSAWTLCGVDLRERPRDLDGRVEWCTAMPDGVVGLVLANEWLDVVPVDVVGYDDGWWVVLVDTCGHEQAGPRPDAAELEWLERWWPSPRNGDRVEVGLSRDQAWAGVVRRLARGLAVAVDYAVDPAHHTAGSLTAYRAGRTVSPVPDGSCDLTAHVRFDAVADAGVSAGAAAAYRLSQRDALELLCPPDEPSGSALADLARRSELAELRARSGLGAFTWLMQWSGEPPPRDRAWPWLPSGRPAGRPATARRRRPVPAGVPTGR